MPPNALRYRLCRRRCHDRRVGPRARSARTAARTTGCGRLRVARRGGRRAARSARRAALRDARSPRGRHRLRRSRRRRTPLPTTGLPPPVRCAAPRCVARGRPTPTRCAPGPPGRGAPTAAPHAHARRDHSCQRSSVSVREIPRTPACRRHDAHARGTRKSPGPRRLRRCRLRGTATHGWSRRPDARRSRRTAAPAGGPTCR